MLYIVDISNLPTSYLKEQPLANDCKDYMKDAVNINSKYRSKDRYRDSFSYKYNQKDDKIGALIKYRIGNSNMV